MFIFKALFMVVSLALIPLAYLVGVVDKMRTLSSQNDPKSRILNNFLFIPFGIPILLMDFLADFNTYIEDLRKERPHLMISGDVNICHKEIDIHNPVSNKKSSGFLPEERQWVTDFLAMGYVDTFREFHREPHQYSWWTYRFGARKKNLGWRIDYHFVTETLKSQLKNADILSEAVHSDHCPVLVEIDD